MATRRSYLDFVLDGLSGLGGVTYRPMMGEYILYYRGRVAAYICDDRLLVRPTPSARAMMPHAPEEPPYPGAKPMLLVEEVDDRAFLTALFTAIADELPARQAMKKTT